MYRIVFHFQLNFDELIIKQNSNKDTSPSLTRTIYVQKVIFLLFITTATCKYEITFIIVLR